MIGKLEIQLKKDLSELQKMNDFIDCSSQKFNVPLDLISPIKLAIEEALVNVINYAYPDEIDGIIILECERAYNNISYILKDYGTPFDPTQVKDADITLSAEDRPIGGLGIFLIRQIMDEVTYVRDNDCNVLKLIKNLN